METIKIKCGVCEGLGGWWRGCEIIEWFICPRCNGKKILEVPKPKN